MEIIYSFKQIGWFLQFVRSTPGVTAPLIGQKSESHVTENMDIMKIPPLSESEFNELLKKMVNRS